MKKYFVIALAAFSMAFVSCKQKSVEDQAKAYAAQIVELMKSGDMSKGDALEKEIEDWAKGLSEADQAKVKTIMEEEMTKAAEEMFGGLSADIDEAEEAIEDAADEAVEAIEDAVEDIAE